MGKKPKTKRDPSIMQRAWDTRRANATKASSRLAKKKATTRRSEPQSLEKTIKGLMEANIYSKPRRTKKLTPSQRAKLGWERRRAKAAVNKYDPTAPLVVDEEAVKGMSEFAEVAEAGGIERACESMPWRKINEQMEAESEAYVAGRNTERDMNDAQAIADFKAMVELQQRGGVAPLMALGRITSMAVYRALKDQEAEILRLKFGENAAPRNTDI